jgi:hypothetical protein
VVNDSPPDGSNRKPLSLMAMDGLILIFREMN